MGFYHESDVIYTFAGFLKKTYPEYRIHLYKRLARFAFETGHPYWGWRFAGMGLHYLADLAQPYHARALPGVGTSFAMWINTLDMMGIGGSQGRRRSARLQPPHGDREVRAGHPPPGLRAG